MRARPPTTNSGAVGTLESRFRDLLETCPELIPARSRALVALSGGPDSTALLHLLVAVRDHLQLVVGAAHFDHRLRATSSAEAAMVAERCRGIGISCRIGIANRPLRNQGEYREARYEFLTGEAARWGADRVALAHQRDDQEETVLLNLLRGTGLKGLGGMPVRRGCYVRPLLRFSRDELRTYVTERDLDWVEDPSNQDPRYARARVRNALLPRLRGASMFGQALSQLAENARIAEAGVDRRAARLLNAVRAKSPQVHGGAQIARSGLLEYDRADQALILRKIARSLGFRLGRRATEAAVEFIPAGSSGTGVDLGRGLRMVREYDRIRIGGVREPTRDRDLLIHEPDAGTEAFELGGQPYTVRWGRAATNDPWTATFPVHRLQFPLLVRAPRPGDRIRTQSGSRKLKKLLNEHRVPRSERGQVPVLVGADRRVLWVVGHSIESGDLSDCNEERFTIGVGQL